MTGFVEKLKALLEQIGSDIREIREKSQSGSVQQDTGWRDITHLIVLPMSRADSTKPVTASGLVFYRRIGNVCYITLEGYAWSENGQTMGFLPKEICEYSRPPEYRSPLDNRIKTMRCGGLIGRGDMVDHDFAFDWLSKTSIRLQYTHRGRLSWGMGSWITDTPFPAEAQIIGEKVEYQ